MHEDFADLINDSGAVILREGDSLLPPTLDARQEDFQTKLIRSCKGEAEVDTREYEDWMHQIMPVLSKVRARAGDDYLAYITMVTGKVARITWQARTLRGVKHLYTMLEGFKTIREQNKLPHLNVQQLEVLK